MFYSRQFCKLVLCFIFGLENENLEDEVANLHTGIFTMVFIKKSDVNFDYHIYHLVRWLIARLCGICSDSFYFFRIVNLRLFQHSCLFMKKEVNRVTKIAFISYYTTYKIVGVYWKRFVCPSVCPYVCLPA